jgi:hypothetical protein
VLGWASPGNAQPRPGLKAQPLNVASQVSAPKSPTSRLAKSDQALLARTDSAIVNIVIKLDYDSVATYVGGVRGYPATSPAVTGRPLTGSADEARYTGYIATLENTVLADLGRRVPQARVGQRLRTVYGGVAAVVPANRVKDLLSIKGVVAVQSDSLRKPLTDASPAFLRATSLYPQLGGTSNAGRGVIFGVLDTGAWPEHPSFADQGNLSAPPPRPDGQPRVCNFGDDPFTPANDPFACQKKLIQGQPFLATYLSDPARAAAEPFQTARDSNGHGTHTGSTAAGDRLTSAPVLGVDRGPLNGMAPGAYVAVYKVCGIQGCFDSDSAAAVQDAIRAGVKVINFSISGGTDPFSDPVELAFLDAYAAGVFVSASAGNEGPGAGTVNHVSPWVTSVAASTQRREFDSTLTVRAGNGDAVTFVGASITPGAGPAPVVLSSEAPYGNANCSVPAPAGTFTGKIVACQRGGGIARVTKGFNVLQGGAVGMILYNPTLADVETDTHYLPTVHLADGTQFVAFMNSHTGEIASFTAGTRVQGQGDVMAAFSSRGPGGNFVKPDVTAPGVQILAGDTPFEETVGESGPAGELFQAIAGTSMSSPHTAGAALLLRALHPDWTPGQIKSALMTTAVEQVVKEDLTTASDPFDRGAGRIDLQPAGNPGLTLDETAARMAALGNDPLNAVHLNVPSVNAPIMPGSLTTTRTVKNVTSRIQNYQTSADAPAGTAIDVSPRTFSVRPGQTAAIIITIRATVGSVAQQKFGAVRLRPTGGAGLPALHLPVAFRPTQGAVGLTSTCAASEMAVGSTTDCTVTATNNSFQNTTVALTTTTNDPLAITAANGATLINPHRVVQQATLPGAQPGAPSIDPGELFGYIPLDAFGVTPTSIGDEDILNFNVPAFNYTGVSYNTVGVDSNGYIVVGGGTAEDNNCCNLPPQIPDPARPNNILAPFWTDLDGTGAPGIFAAVLTDGVNSWLVIEWRVNVFGTTSGRVFQVWIGVNGPEDITFAYNPAALPGDPNGQRFLVGAENVNGTGGDQLPEGQLPTTDLRVTSTAPTPGGSTSYTITVRGDFAGTGQVTTSMVSPIVPGTTVVGNTIIVR